MGRPGEIRTFKENGVTVRLIPIVATQGTYADPHPSDRIEDIVVSSCDGPSHAIDRVCRDITDRYKGSLYSTWLAGIADAAQRVPLYTC